MSKNSNHDLDYKTKMVVGLFAVAVLLLICIYGSWFNQNLPVVTIKVEGASIYQDETVPVFAAYASFGKANEQLILDEKTDYQIKHLLEDLNQGKGYQLKYSIDPSKEGKYLIEVVLDETLKEKFAYDWSSKIKYHLEEGILTVKNKHGEWEGNKFKKRDGSYAVNEFMLLNEDTYYFDSEGCKVTGEQKINGCIYYFDKNGKFDAKKNRVNPAKPMIALTFDDGPGKYTEELLAKLKEYDARATFFLLGENVNKYPEIVEEMVNIGCELGNHTTNHKNLTKLDVEEMQSQIETTNTLIQNLTGEKVAIVRPPYGAVNAQVRENVAYPFIMWSVDTTDWERKDAESIKNYTLDVVQDGDIILMHDIHEYTVEATIAMIPELIERGYQLVTVSEMAEVHGVKLENGTKYFEF